MHKPLTADERRALSAAFGPDTPVQPLKLTRYQKLMRWAEIIFKHPTPIAMLHEIEYMDSVELAQARVTNSIFDIASKDPMLGAAGLKEDNALAGKRFFGLTKDDLHHIACGCHGQLTNKQMAARIAGLTAEPVFYHTSSI